MTTNEQHTPLTDEQLQQIRADFDMLQSKPQDRWDIMDTSMMAALAVLKVPVLLAEVERQREMLTELVAAIDATHVKVLPYAGVGHTQIVGPLPETLTKVRTFLASREVPA